MDSLVSDRDSPAGAESPGAGFTACGAGAFSTVPEVPDGGTALALPLSPVAAEPAAAPLTTAVSVDEVFSDAVLRVVADRELFDLRACVCRVVVAAGDSF